jgi:hypothetical protein
MISGMIAPPRHPPRQPRRSLLRGVLLCCLGMPIAAAADSSPPIDELMQALASVPARQAAFIEIKSIAALAVPISSTGTLAYRRPAYFAKITAPPHAERLVVDGDRLSVAEGDQDPQVMQLDSRPRLRALVDAVRGTLAGDLATLRRWYQVAMSGSVAAWRLTLTPTDPGIASLLRFIAIEGTGATPRTIRSVQANGDESRMTINPQP